MSLYFFLKESLIVNSVLIKSNSLILADYDDLSEMLEDYNGGRLFCSCKQGEVNEEFVLTDDSMAWPRLMEFLR